MTEYLLILVCTLMPVIGISQCERHTSQPSMFGKVQDGIDQRESQTKKDVFSAYQDPLLYPQGRIE